MGRHGLGKRNENGDIIIQLCVNYNLIIGGSLFLHKDIKPDGWLQIIALLTICLPLRNGRSLLDVRGYRGWM